MAKKIIEILKNKEDVIDKISRANNDALDYKWEKLKRTVD